MSYDIAFKVKVEGVDAYVAVGNCEANVTWNVREIIEPCSWVECAVCKAASQLIFDKQEQNDGMEEAVEAWNRRVENAEIH